MARKPKPKSLAERLRAHLPPFIIVNEIVGPARAAVEEMLKDIGVDERPRDAAGIIEPISSVKVIAVELGNHILLLAPIVVEFKASEGELLRILGECTAACRCVGRVVQCCENSNAVIILAKPASISNVASAVFEIAGGMTSVAARIMAERGVGGISYDYGGITTHM